MTQYSVLDLCPVGEGHTAQDSFKNSLSLARFAEARGYHRFWLAEHHNMTGIASAATSVVIGHIAAGTERIRVGAGGVMLPNHSPLQVAESYGTLECLFPGRIDLGLGRAPGTDQATAHALRRNLKTDSSQFPQDVIELLGYFSEVQAGQKVVAVPGAGLQVPVWILGSSLFGAQLAAAMGLPYAFASHFAPGDLLEAIALYRRDFKPSKYLSEPYVMAGFNVIAANTDEEATFLVSSLQQMILNLHLGRPGKLPEPKEGLMDELGLRERSVLMQMLACSAIGSTETVARQVDDFIRRTQVDELMITSNIHSHEKRLNSYAMFADVMGSL